MYKLAKDPLTQEQNKVVRLADNAWIPMNLDNTDYQAYLKWLEEGNSPIPAENE